MITNDGRTLCDRCGRAQGDDEIDWKHIHYSGGVIDEGAPDDIDLCPKCDRDERNEVPF